MTKRLLLLFVCSAACSLSALSQKIISQLQYWIDSGERTEMAFNGSDTTFVIDGSKAKEGLHTISYRVKDSDGMYSPLHTWIFLRKGSEPDVEENSILVVHITHTSNVFSECGSPNIHNGLRRRCASV